MVNNQKQDNAKERTQQASSEPIPKAYKIGASTPFDFEAKNLTSYGGLLPVGVMLEKLKFQQLFEETVQVKRKTRVLSGYGFLLAMVLAMYLGLSRLNHLSFLKLEPMVLGLLQTLRLPPQCTFWRFLASLHRETARQLLEVQRKMRERVWAAANVGLTSVVLDTDTTVHTLFGRQMGARKGYNPKNRGKKSYQPILTFIAETREYLLGELHNGDRPSGAKIARHLKRAIAALPQQVKVVFARADSGFYCWEAVEAYEKHGAQFIIVARKTSRLVEQLQAADWKPAAKSTEADQQCEFVYQPKGWGRAHRFIALRYKKKPEDRKGVEQYQLFDTPQYTYRVFVTNMKTAIPELVWFYRQRAGAENLIQEANNHAGLAAYPSNRWDMNCNHVQIAMLAYNLNCWLMLFSREEKETATSFKHVQLATARLKFLFVAAKIFRHAGKVGVSFSDHYQEKPLLQRLMDRLTSIGGDQENVFGPVIGVAFCP